MRRRGNRMPSGPWGRLKPVEQDPLQSVGYPSKGDGRLLHSETQKWYYNQIIRRFLSFCTDAGERDELLRRLDSLDIRAVDAALASAPRQPTPKQPRGSTVQSTRVTAATERLASLSIAGPSSDASRLPSSASLPTVAESSTSASAKPSKEIQPIIPPSGPSDSMKAALQNPSNTKELQDVLMALRKLREGLVASKRADEFACQAYIFSIRLSIFVKHPESYHPAMLHLLRYIAKWHNMPHGELAEIASYYALDAACRRKNLAEAYSIRTDFKIKNRKLDVILRALAHDNYVAWQNIKYKVDLPFSKLMEWADDDMRLHTLKCFGASYLNVDLPFLEFCTGRKWDELKEKDSVGWELEEEKVTIRRIRKK